MSVRIPIGRRKVYLNVTDKPSVRLAYLQYRTAEIRPRNEIPFSRMHDSDAFATRRHQIRRAQISIVPNGLHVPLGQLRLIHVSPSFS